jgi:hypothetical protein
MATACLRGGKATLSPFLDTLEEAQLHLGLGGHDVVRFEEKIRKNSDS